MALSQLAKNVRRLHQLHAKIKALEPELDALKEFFRAESGGQDVTFSYQDMEVMVTAKERSGWDSDKLQLELGTKVPEFKKTSRYQEVSCRRAAAVAAGKSKKKAA